MHGFICPICEDEFSLSIQDGIEANKEVFLRIVHDHDWDPAKWLGVVHEKGARGVPGKNEVELATRVQGKDRLKATQQRNRKAGDDVDKQRRERK